MHANFFTSLLNDSSGLISIMVLIVETIIPGEGCLIVVKFSMTPQNALP
jgi:hypothetical protein